MKISLILPHMLLKFVRSRWYIFLVLFFLLDVSVVYTFQTSRQVSAGDFFIPWYATREMVLYDQNPYSPEITHKIQVAMTGSEFGPEVEDQLSFNYPLYTALYLLPLIPFDYPLAEAIWNVINQFALAGTVWLILQLIGWSDRVGIYRILPYLAAYFCYPFLYTIAYGQYTIVTLFFAALGGHLLQRGRYFTGSLFVTLALFKPQTGALLVACLLWWCLLAWKQRYHALFGGVLVGMTLLFGPMLWLVDWPWRWLEQAGYRRLHPGMYSFNEEFVHRFGLNWSNAIAVGSGLAVVMGLGLIWLWFRDRHDPRRFAQLFALTGLLTLLILPQWGLCNDIAFYPAALLLLSRLQSKLNQRAFVLLTLSGAILSFAFVLAVPWLWKSGLVIIAMVWLGRELWPASPRQSKAPSNL